MEISVHRLRVPVSRAVGLLALVLILFTGHSFAQDGLLDVAFETVGLFLLTIAALGRLWALLYISGYKKREVVRTGPYSIIRHPLYFFSFIGVLGIGLASENLLVLGVLTAFYVAYYPIAVRQEEKRLVQELGDSYREYMAEVPAVLPRLSLYQAADHYDVKATQFLRSLGDAMWFVWVFLALHGIEALQEWGVVPVLWRFP